MLQSIRKSVSSWVVKLMFVPLVLSFAIWGIGDLFRSAIDTSVAVVGNTKISAQIFTAEFNRQLQVMRRQFGGQLDAQTAANLGLADTVVNRMVMRSALDQRARGFGLLISDEQVKREIQTNPAFQNDFGDFDKFQFNRIVSNMRMSERQFIDTIRDDMARSEMITTLVAGAQAPDALATAIYRHRFEKRSAEFFIVRHSDITGVGDPDDEALATYFRDHTAEYTAPEYRTLSYITLEPKDLVGEIDISDENLREEYALRLDEFGTVESRTVAQILVSDQQQAQGLYDRIGGDGLAYIQAAFELDNSTIDDITLGSLGRAELGEMVGPDVADTIFDLQEGAISKPIETSFGWHLFQVSEVQLPDSRPFEEVREELRVKVLLENATDALYDTANSIDDAVAGGADLEEIAPATGLTVRTIGPLDRSGRDSAGNVVTALPQAANFLSAAFEKEIAEDLYLDETDEGGYFVVRVDGITAPAVKDLRTIRSAVTIAWQIEQRDQQLKERAEKLIETAELGGDFAALAESSGKTLERAASFDRNGVGARPAMSRQLVGQLFDMGRGYTMAPTLERDGYILAKVTGVTPGDPLADQTGLRGVERAINRGFGDDVLAQYNSALRAQIGSQINRDLMMALFDPNAAINQQPLGLTR